MPAKLKKTFNSTILYAWIFSYILAVCMPIVFSAVTLFHSQKIHEKSVLSSSGTVLSGIGENVYSQLSYVESFATKLSTNNYVSDLSSLSEGSELSPSDYENLFQLSSLLSEDIFFNTGDYLFRPYIFFHNLNIVIGPSGSYSPDEFYSVLVTENGEVEEFTKKTSKTFSNAGIRKTSSGFPVKIQKYFMH